MSAKPDPPAHLSADMKRWYSSVVDGWALEDHHRRVLVLACEAWDRAQQARKTIAREGATYRDRFGSPRKHPAVSIEENACTAFARLVRELNLNEDDPAVSRLPRIGGRR
jgi:P27 family predicted phage terminase small subunit